MKQDILNKLFAASLKVRILRACQKARNPNQQEFSERELFALELINDFGPITEKGLCLIFVLPFSTVSEMIKKLTGLGFIDGTAKARGKALKLTEKGKSQLIELKRASAARYAYIFESMSDTDSASLLSILNTVEKNADKYIKQNVLDRFEPE